MLTSRVRGLASLSQAAYGYPLGDISVEGFAPLSAVHFIADESTSTEGLIYKNDAEVVVALRGTQEPKDWITDISVEMVSPDFGGGDCHVHKGFLHAVQAVWPQVRAAIHPLAANHKVTLTGHSLGGALASLMMPYVSSDGYSYPEVVTFGSPRVGNDVWTNLFSLLSPGSMRMVHQGDIVPRIPGHELGYRHVFPARTVSDAGTVSVAHYDLPILGDAIIELPVIVLAIEAHGIAKYRAALAAVQEKEL